MPYRKPFLLVAADPGRLDLLDIQYQQVRIHQADIRSKCKDNSSWWEKALVFLICSRVAALFWPFPC